MHSHRMVYLTSQNQVYFSITEQNDYFQATAHVAIVCIDGDSFFFN